MDTAYSPQADLDACLSALKWNDKLAVSVRRIRAENSPVISKSEIYCFSSEENIFAFPTTIRMSRKYEFKTQVNSLIRRCLEAGLFTKWQEDTELSGNDSKPKSDRNINLTVAHIGGALLSLVCGLCLASLVFIAECVAFEKLKQKDCHQFWVYLSRTVDGRRFYCREALVRPKTSLVNAGECRLVIFLPPKNESRLQIFPCSKDN